MERREIDVEGRATPISHYCDAVTLGDLVFVSGIIPVDVEGRLIGGDDPAAQAKEVFDQLRGVLEAAGSGVSEVAKITVFLTHIADRAAINPVRQACFGRTRPASTLVEVSALVVPGVRIEVEAVARRKPVSAS